MKWLGYLCGGLFLVSCASAPKLESYDLSGLDLKQPQALLTEVPFIHQEKGHCGPASLAMMLGAINHPVDLALLTEQVYVPKAKGSFQTDMLSAVRRQGLVALPIGSFQELLKEVENGSPVLVFQNLAFRWYPYWHYAVVTGYDLQNKTVTLHSGPQRHVNQPMKIFEQSWRLADSWAYVVLPPGRLSITSSEQQQLEAALGLEESGHLEKALKVYESIGERWEGSLRASLASANILYKLKDLEKANEILIETTKRHPTSFESWNNLSVVQNELGHKKASINSLARAEALQKKAQATGAESSAQ